MPKNPMLRRIEDPHKAILEVGKENTELHEEMASCHRQIDYYRRTLTLASERPGDVGEWARAVLKNVTK